MNFSAVILAGGKSSRMGCDKAFLEVGGETLLARQIRLVQAVGATEVFISGRDGADYSAFAGRVLLDELAEAGPLAGIERALAAMDSSLLLVLAVDLPDMSVDFLCALATHCPDQRGAIPRVKGLAEPLVAFYPKAAHALAASRLNQKLLAVKDFAAACVLAGHARFVDLPAREARYFANWNSPADCAQSCPT
jgi:molybdopterin-guanine dinucleotide biosynthesis protein A